MRTNSTVKKPSTFKSVSVTKNFLAKSAVSTPISRPGDKTAPAAPTSTSALLTAKPRLVAKLGTSNTPRTLGKVNGVASGPDASKVWNKNQPVPTPPPKQFTDEELKQQYGIHLATRLQADEAGKEAKWADIDDDEDDWAPETVQWMDGTKSSVAVVEDQPPVEEPKTILKPEPQIVASEPMPPTATTTATSPSTSAPKASLTSGSKTILKPGAHTQPPTGKSSLVLKGQPERPTLVAKPSATEKKSPWATLPPVEKVSPLQANPPGQQQQQQQQPRFSQRDSHGYDSMPPPLTKEIAPDDFNRSWRDERGASGRELFNSQSGRYEPVNDVRRGSVRDAGYRQQPSVLQRPLQDGPAEPSAAFQTSRANGDMPTWGRRRNSSNVSAGNIRRMSIDRRAPDMPNAPMSIERRESQSINGPDSAEGAATRQSPFAQAVSPNATPAHPASPFGSVASAATHDQPPLHVAPPAEDPVEVQKRLMAEKIERARSKKQQEQEAEKKAEAERKERIAKKLAALGPPAESKSKSKGKEQSPSRALEQSSLKESVSASVSSPPKPPVPTADGEIAQYGMMKVHQPHPIKRTSPPIETAKATKQAEPAAGPPLVRAPPSLHQSPPLPFDTFPRENDKSRQSVEQARGLVHHPERTVSSEAKTHQPAWSQAPHPRPWTSQVWGPPPTKERALGNGTFDSSYNRGQSRPGTQQQLPVQPAASIPPIGMGLAPQTSSSQVVNQLPVTQPMYAHVTSLPVQVVVPSKPGPIAPPLAKGWGNFEADIAKDDANTLTKARQDRERVGEAYRPEIRETYKDQRGQAQTTLHNKVGVNVVLPESNKKKEEVVNPILEGPSVQQGLGQSTSLQQGTGPRASRFFPRPTESMTSTPTTASGKTDSPPPPPETETHPAFTGDIGHPLVKLPRPSPVVRLPPSASGNDPSMESSVCMPARGQSLGARPLAMNPEWQARFNKLLEKPNSTSSVPGSLTRVASTATSAASTKISALAPFALSKSTLEVRGTIGPATVSLPIVSQTKSFTNDGGKDAVTRKDAEALFEDREFGSLPTVKLSKVPHIAADKPAASVPKDEMHPRFNKFENPFTIRRLEAFDFEKQAQKVDVVVYLPRMREAIIRSMPRKRRVPKNNSQFKSRQNSGPIGSLAGGSKDRTRKPSQQAQGEHPTSSPRPPPSNVWSNPTRPGAPHQQTTWAKRAAAPVY